MSLIGYVIGTQCPKTVKVRAPSRIFLPKYQKAIVKHKNYLAHDETGSCLVGDVVRLEQTPAFDECKRHAVAEMVQPAERFVDSKTRFVYTNGHLKIPVGYMNEEGRLINRIPQEMYKQMGLI